MTPLFANVAAVAATLAATAALRVYIFLRSDAYFFILLTGGKTGMNMRVAPTCETKDYAENTECDIPTSI